MSQSDSFIDEVTEEVRRDRLYSLMRRYGWIAIVVVLLVVGAAAWNEYRKADAAASAQALGDALIEALEQDTAEERVAALDAVPADTSGQMAVTRFLKASEAATAGDYEGAADTLLQIADDTSLPDIYRRLARFKALTLQANSLPPAERRAGFEQLSQPGTPLRLLAQEQIALTHAEEGDAETALEVLRAIEEDAEVTPGLRQRISQLMVALGDDPTSGQAAPDGEEPPAGE